MQLQREKGRLGKLAGAQLDVNHSVSVAGAQLDMIRSVSVAEAQLDTIHSVSVAGAQLDMIRSVSVAEAQLDAIRSVSVAGAQLDMNHSVSVAGAQLDTIRSAEAVTHRHRRKHPSLTPGASADRSSPVARDCRSMLAWQNATRLVSGFEYSKRARLFGQDSRLLKAQRRLPRLLVLQLHLDLPSVLPEPMVLLASRHSW